MAGVKVGHVHLCQVAGMCDHTWQVMLRSSEMGYHQEQSGRVRSGQVFIVQLLSAIDASATNSLHCSLSSVMPLSVILCLPDVFLNLVTPALLRSSSTQSIHLFDGVPLDLFPLGGHSQKYLRSICTDMTLT